MHVHFDQDFVLCTCFVHVHFDQDFVLCNTCVQKIFFRTVFQGRLVFNYFKNSIPQMERIHI